jgi:hypothetical protein
LVAHLFRQSELSGRNAVATTTRTLFLESSLIPPSHTESCAGTSHSHNHGVKRISCAPHLKTIQCNTLSVTNDLVTLFMGVLSLRSLAIQGPLALSVLPMASRTLTTTLLQLSIVVKDAASMDSLGYIHVFSNMRHLEVIIEDDTSTSPPTILPIKPWNMKDMQKLAIRVSPAWSVTLTEFLRKCQFRSLKSLELSLPTRSASQAVYHLNTFFRGLPDLREASLQLSGHTYESILPALSVVSLEISPLTRAAMGSLSPVTTSIRVPLSVVGGAGSAIWPALDGLIAAPQTAVKTVHLVGNNFSWISQPNGNGSVGANLQSLPYLFRYSALLMQAGIELKDESGKTLLNYLQAK